MVRAVVRFKSGGNAYFYSASFHELFQKIEAWCLAENVKIDSLNADVISSAEMRQGRAK